MVNIIEPIAIHAGTSDLDVKIVCLKNTYIRRRSFHVYNTEDSKAK